MARTPPVATTMHHGVVLGAVGSFAVTLFSTLSVAVLGLLPTWALFTIAAVLAFAALVAGVKRHQPPSEWAYRVACLLALGGWTLWPLLGGWHLTVWGPAVVILIVAVVVGAMMAPAFVSLVVNPLDVAQQQAVRGACGSWQSDINKAGGWKPEDGAVALRVKRWRNGAGEDVFGEWAPGAPRTYRDLQSIQTVLAAMRRLKPGCTIEADEGEEHQGSWVLHVTTRNDLHTKIATFPLDEIRQRSLRDPLDIGRNGKGELTYVELYQSCLIISGQRDAGKTVLLQTLTGQLVQCTDVLVWHADLNGGGMSAPWARPYATNLVKRCAVDWIATTPEQALAMAEVGLAIARDRKSRYQGVLLDNDTDVLPIDETRPAIVIIVDEGGEVFGDSASKVAREASEALRELQRIGRSMCVQVEFSVQRATSTYVSSDMKKGAALSVAMRCKDDADISHLMDWSGLRARDLVSQGSAYIRFNQQDPSMFRTYLTKPRAIEEISRRVETWRPVLDDPGKAIGGQVYAQRWDVLRPWLQTLAGVQPDQQDVAVATMERPVPGSVEHGRQVWGAFGVDDDVARPADDPPASGGSGGGGGQLPDWARDVLAGIDKLDTDPGLVLGRQAADDAAAPAGPDEADEAVPAADGEPAAEMDGRAFVLWYIEAASADGRKTGDVIDEAMRRGYTKRRQTVQEWIGEHQRAKRIMAKPDAYAMWIAVRYAT